MKRILLIRAYKDVGAGGSVPPLGLLYLSSFLKSRPGGAEVRLLDTCFSADPESDIRRAAAEFKPDIAGLSALACEKDLAARAAAAVKAAAPSAVTVLGGPYATFSPAQALEESALDYALTGEGERSFAQLAEALCSGRNPAGIPGLAYREGGSVKTTAAGPYLEDLDSLPFPDWNLIDFRKYGGLPTWNGYNKRAIYAPVLTSRGCPYRCVYCHNMFGKTVRKRSAGNVLAELLLLRDRYGVTEFHIVDDVFNCDKARLLEICAAVKEKLPGTALAFPNGLRADLLDDESAAALAAAGTYKVHFGIESASDAVRSAAKKDLSLDAVERAVTACAKHGITSAGYFMFGLPGETPAEAEKTISYAAASRLDAAYFFRATAYPGTEFHALAGGGQEGSFFDTSGPETEEKRKELETLLIRAQLDFYLSFRRLLNLVRRSHDKKGFLRAFPAFLARLLLLKLLFEVSGK